MGGAESGAVTKHSIPPPADAYTLPPKAQQADRK